MFGALLTRMLCGDVNGRGGAFKTGSAMRFTQSGEPAERRLSLAAGLQLVTGGLMKMHIAGAHADFGEGPFGKPCFCPQPRHARLLIHWERG